MLNEQQQSRQARALIEAAPDGILLVDATGRILLVNPAMERLSGYRADQLIGQGVEIFLPPTLRAKHADLLRSYFARPSPHPMGAVSNLQLHRPDGSGVPVDIALGLWQEDGQDHAVAFIRDVSEHKRREDRLRHQATHDALTGLPNRWLFQRHLDHALARATRSGHRGALLFLDLDNFKAVNDSFGHAIGDLLLVQVAHRLRTSLRESDTLARLGGDEFVVLLADLEAMEDAAQVAHKLIATFSVPYALNGRETYSGGSLGIAFYPDDAKDAAALLKCADMAMYQAKQNGRGAYAYYSPSLELRVREAAQQHTRLHQALD